MKIKYILIIDNPASHIVKVRISAKCDNAQSEISFFLPTWSPGSYMIRDYSRNVRKFSVTSKTGKVLHHQKISKSIWKIQTEKNDEIDIAYEVYANELTVRTSHINSEHAFLHLPCFLMAPLEYESMVDPEIEFRFPPVWSKLHTSLRDISTDRTIFLYSAKNYDELIDSPVEIGCHDSDGFQAEGINHHIAYFGKAFFDSKVFKEDIKKIVETNCRIWGDDIPYENYLFIIHLLKETFGGLEHLNSTVLQYDCFSIGTKEGYLDWLSLVAHEHFHTWNVKRVKPIELGPFNYLEENYTKMHWLTEGLTTYMEYKILFQANLCSEADWAKHFSGLIKRYNLSQGRLYDSVEDASFDAWIKQYKIDENSSNRSVSYYLKGALIFLVLDTLFFEKDISMISFIQKLWLLQKSKGNEGLIDTEVYNLIESHSHRSIRDELETMVQTTQELDLIGSWSRVGIEPIFESPELFNLDMTLETKGTNLFVKSIKENGFAYKKGFHTGDEILAINQVRVLSNDWKNIEKVFKQNNQYEFLVVRNGNLLNLNIVFDQYTKEFSTLKIVNQAKLKNFLLN